MKIINVYVRGTEMYPSDNHADMPETIRQYS